MPQAAKKTASLRAMYDAIEQHLISWKSLAKSKSNVYNLPRTTKGSRKGVASRDVKTLREEIHHCSRNCRKPEEHAREQRGRQTHQKKIFGIKSSFLLNEKNQKPLPKCFYGERSNWHDECCAVSTLQKQKEKSRGFCYV